MDIIPLRTRTRFIGCICFLIIVCAACQRDQQDVPTPTVVLNTAENGPQTGSSSSTESETNTAVATRTPAPTAVPSPTPQPKHAITLCMATEPADLYLYGDNSTTAVALRHAIHENLYTNTDYTYQAQGLEKLPDLSAGDAYTQTVTVQTGDKVIDATGTIVTLIEDVAVIDATGANVVFRGEPLQMQQLVAEFTFKPLVWSDGTAVSATDSVFSYELAANPDTPGPKSKTNHTASYTAIDDLTVQWIGIPGYVDDQTYFTNVWQPLPKHQLGQTPLSTLLTMDEVRRMPLSSGPFVVDSWADGVITLVANPHYYRAAEGLPHLARIDVRFGELADFVSAPCDVISNDVVGVQDLETLAQIQSLDTLKQPGNVFEQISFGVMPVMEYADNRPDWFGNPQVRQAMTMCTDRQRMVDELTAGEAEIMHAYVPQSHPLFPDDATLWPYDPAAANALLDQAGYLDFAGDGRRQDVASGVPMTITLGTNNESDLRLRITEIFAENMADCGIPVDRYELPAGTWFADGPLGRVFGRRFDLAEFAWISRTMPDCGLFLSDNITGPTEFDFGGWSNVNVTGWSNAEYDAACQAALSAMPGGADFVENHQEALRIFTQELPIIPLFTNVKVAAARSELLKLKLDASEPSLLWNLYEWDLAE